MESENEAGDFIGQTAVAPAALARLARPTARAPAAESAKDTTKAMRVALRPGTPAGNGRPSKSCQMADMAAVQAGASSGVTQLYSRKPATQARAPPRGGTAPRRSRRTARAPSRPPRRGAKAAPSRRRGSP